MGRSFLFSQPFDQIDTGDGNAERGADPIALATANTPIGVDDDPSDFVPLGRAPKASPPGLLTAGHLGHQVDAGSRARLDAPATVDAMRNVDLVLEIAQVTAL
jgi:hypothetical protein